MTFRDQLTLWLPTIFWTGFFTVLGACIGSLINVLVYRLPRGLGVVTPSSRCPSCATKLTWRENIPVLGWIILRGRCRFCRSRISVEYPLVEAFVGVVFGGLYLLWYSRPGDLAIMSDPAWVDNGLLRTWPVFATTLIALACMVAMTIIDWKTYTIPLVLAWIPAVVAVIALPAHAAWVEWNLGGLATWNDVPGGWRTGSGALWRSAEGWLWTLPTPGPAAWRLAGSCIGAVIGLLASAVLVRLGLIRQSFADYDEWEAQTIAEREAAGGETSEGAAGPELWVAYPHARREMIKELAFLAPPVLLFLVGGEVAYRIVGLVAGPWHTLDAFGGGEIPAAGAPLWLLVLTGVLLGYLVGGGVVWAIRIFGSLAFGKEAMGIGDVHLMAGIGACFGWIDVSLGFFAAAFVALAWTLLTAVAAGSLRRAMPFGPFLVVGTALVVLFQPVIEAGLTLLVASPTPIVLP